MGADPTTGASAAVTGSPAIARSTSARMSAADWYRSSGRFANAFSTIASMLAGTDGSSWLGGAGCSLTCW